MNDPILGLVARLHKLGRPPHEIAKRVNKPIGWVHEVINDSEVREIQEAFPDMIEDDGTEIWSGDAKRYHQERLVPACFRLWESIINDPDAKHSDKLKASENIMKYDTTLVDTTKVSEEKITNWQMTDEQLQRLIRLKEEEKQWQ